jgi:predicted aminopeptidase
MYVADDTAFNEAFATADGPVGRGTLAGAARRRRASGRNMLTDIRRREQFLRRDGGRPRTTGGSLCLRRGRRSGETDLDKQRILTQLREQYRELKQGWGGYTGYDRWFEQDLNNAKLAGVSTYHRQVPAFLTLFEREGRDFAAFYRAAEAIGQLPPPEREARLRMLSAPFRLAGKPVPLVSSD